VNSNNVSNSNGQNIQAKREEILKNDNNNFKNNIEYRFYNEINENEIEMENKNVEKKSSNQPGNEVISDKVVHNQELLNYNILRNENIQRNDKLILGNEE